MNNEELYNKCSLILEDIWLNIDWRKIHVNRRRNIYSEFESQAKVLSRCFNSLPKFIDKLCLRMDSRVTSQKTLEIIKEYNDNELLDIFRFETQIPILMMKLRREENQEKYNKYLDIKEEVSNLPFNYIKNNTPQILE
jgi:hypothetical protein